MVETLIILGKQSIIIYIEVASYFVLNLDCATTVDFGSKHLQLAMPIIELL